MFECHFHYVFAPLWIRNNLPMSWGGHRIWNAERLLMYLINFVGVAVAVTIVDTWLTLQRLRRACRSCRNTRTLTFMRRSPVQRCGMKWPRRGRGWRCRWPWFAIAWPSQRRLMMFVMIIHHHDRITLHSYWCCSFSSLELILQIFHIMKINSITYMYFVSIKYIIKCNKMRKKMF